VLRCILNYVGFVMQTNSASAIFSFDLCLQMDDLHQEWERCNMLANYLAAYVSCQFARQERAENLISTIINEFLESLIRLAPEHSDFFLRCTQFEKGLQFSARHRVHRKNRAAYLDFLAEINGQDVEEHYLQLLATEIPSSGHFNQLGLMMLRHDFGVHFTVEEEDTHYIHTQILIPTREFVK